MRAFWNFKFHFLRVKFRAAATSPILSQIDYFSRAVGLCKLHNRSGSNGDEFAVINYQKYLKSEQFEKTADFRRRISNRAQSNGHGIFSFSGESGNKFSQDFLKNYFARVAVRRISAVPIR